MTNKRATNNHKQEDLCGLTICLHTRREGNNFHQLKEEDYKNYSCLGNLTQEYKFTLRDQLPFGFRHDSSALSRGIYIAL